MTGPAMISDFINGQSKGIAQLKRHEGCRLDLYQCTAGAWTIGFGRNLSANGISQEEASTLLNNDIEKYKTEVKDAIPFFKNLNRARQWVLINMAFNMGTAGLLKFKNTLKAIEEKRYHDAAEGMMNSKWAGQVGRRALELARQMDTGKFEGE